MTCLKIPVTAEKLYTVVDALTQYHSVLMEEQPDEERNRLRRQVISLILRFEGHGGYQRGGLPCID
jgi:hypothetical protein